MVENYQAKGRQMPALSETQIAQQAQQTANVLDIKRYFIGKNMLGAERFMDDLLEKIGITINVGINPYEEWEIPAQAISLPDQLAIYLPESLYENIKQYKAQALFILFHEIGHIALGHQATLHFSDHETHKEEDSEWQADCFAKELSYIIGTMKRFEQLSLNLEI